MNKTIVLSIAMSAIVLAVLAFLFHNLFSYQKIPDNVAIDKIVVIKSKHELHAYSKGRTVVVYKIAIGQNPVGDKEFEGDRKTPEGFYTINAKNPNSAYHKNLGISYPNKEDIEQARRLGKPPGGDVKIHGFKN